MKKFGYKEEDIPAGLTEDDLVDRVKRSQNDGADVAFITNTRGEITKLVVKEPISQTTTRDLIQE